MEFRSAMRSLLTALCLFLLLSSPAVAAPGRSLSFEDRVAARTAIERVYYAHQAGARTPFEERVPPGAIAERVRDSLARSAALDALWGSPVTDTMLEAELRRMARHTRFPDRLLQIYEALGRDPILLQECLARPALVERLTMARFEIDARIHGEARKEAERLRMRLVGGEIDPRVDHPLRHVLAGERALDFPDATFRPRPAGAPSSGTVDIGPIIEKKRSFLVHAVVNDGAESRFVYEVRKISWDTWWQQIRREFAWKAVPTLARDLGDLPLPGGASPASGSSPDAGEFCPTADGWDNGILELPIARMHHSAVWTGSEMLVWGGHDFVLGPTDGGRYDPLTETWGRITDANAPDSRWRHHAIWTGSKMIVWGGAQVNSTDYQFDSGGVYDPALDSWIPMSTVAAPVSHAGTTAIWTGEEFIVWGPPGRRGRYRLATDSWSPITAPGIPLGDQDHTAVWTGNEMLVWGGSPTPIVGKYDPALDSWTLVDAPSAPETRKDHVAVWTGTEMIVWGGSPFSGTSSVTGGRFNVGTGTWASLPRNDDARATAAFWTGDEMVTLLNTNVSHRYDLATDTWSANSTLNAPDDRVGFSVAFTGDSIIVWGGSENGLQNDGGRYDVATDTWSPTGPTGVPDARLRHTATWTGTGMLIWGGFFEPGPGAEYDPLLDTWAPLPESGAPEARPDHTAVWTGERMVVWGGGDSLASGGRYDPVLASWEPTSLVGAPTGRSGHSAVWSGTRMIVWGGSDGLGVIDTGALYDPLNDVWSSTATLGAPSPRRDHVAVWTGQEMIVWGGTDGVPLGSGGRYDPASDQWTAMTEQAAPSPRSLPLGAWTGTEMVVLGGEPTGSTGGRYDPASDAWSPTSTVNAPTIFEGATAVWSGDRVIIWRGGQYEPSTDAWGPLSLEGEPHIFADHTAVWTGDFMIVWGGQRRFHVRQGGRWSSGPPVDADGDGFACDLDCRDDDPASFPGATELCDGLDNDCDGLLPPEEGDGDGDGALLCADCDDADPSRFPGNPETCDNQDNDCDEVIDGHQTSCGTGQCASTGLCVAGEDLCVPDPPAPETCDGLDNDCDGVVPPDEIDDDGDGLADCEGDCDDLIANTHPGAPETNDGLDNQCPGEPGAGSVDEIRGVVFPDPANPSLVCWDVQFGAFSYEVLRLEGLTPGSPCLRATNAGTCWLDAALPQLAGVHYLLARPRTPFTGGWGLTSTGDQRAPACGGETICDDGLDDDGDGLHDCEDGDCFGRDGCDVAVFSFTDTTGDDIPDDALQDYFENLPSLPFHYIHVGIDGDVPAFAWCAERANFYRDRYLDWAVTSQAISQPWSRWTMEDGGPWSGPVRGTFENLYGPSCFLPYSWCGELQLAGHFMGVSPAFTGLCEAFDGTCGTGGNTLVIRVGVDRMAACGF